MQNQAAVEALYSATFVEDYLDCVENLPDDLQRHLSRLRELDLGQHQELLQEMDALVTQYEEDCEDPVAQKRLLAKMQVPLIASQDIGDDKINIVQVLTDVIENKTRQLEHDSQNLDFGRGEDEEQPKPPPVKAKEDKGEKGAKRPRKNKDIENVKEDEPTASPQPPKNPIVAAKKPKKAAEAKVNQTNKKIVKRGTAKKTAVEKPEKERGDSPDALANIEIDPDEPTYCLCDQVSYGEMIGCDNDLCPIEWFHFGCVQLQGKPKGKWFCPKCRADKPTVMKAKALFLKELEKYNKEREDKVK